VIGPELMTNGTFDTDTDWGKNASATISGGVLNLTASNDAGTQFLSNTQGKVFLVTFDAVRTSGTNLRIYLGGELVYDNDTPTGSYELVLVAGTTSEQFQLRSNSFVGTIDNISVREIDPLAVSIYMRGEVSYADTDSINEAQFVRWFEDASNYIIHRINTNGANTGQVAFLQTQGGTLENKIGLGTSYSPGQNVPFSIAGRHGSTFINGAVDGTALTADTTPTALADLSAANFLIGTVFNGTISELRVFADDIGDTGLEEVTA